MLVLLALVVGAPGARSCRLRRRRQLEQRACAGSRRPTTPEPSRPAEEPAADARSQDPQDRAHHRYGWRQRPRLQRELDRRPRSRPAEELGIEARVYRIGIRRGLIVPNLVAAAEGRKQPESSPWASCSQGLDDSGCNRVPGRRMFAGIDHFYGTEGDGFSGCEDGRYMRPVPNALGLLFPSEEVWLRCRHRRGADEVRPAPMSTVGGIKIPPVDNWIAGFQARCAVGQPRHRSCSTPTRRTSSTRPSARKSVSIRSLNGSDVVFQVAGLSVVWARSTRPPSRASLAIGVDVRPVVQGRPRPHERSQAACRSAVFDTISVDRRRSLRGRTERAQLLDSRTSPTHSCSTEPISSATSLRRRSDAVEVAIGAVDLGRDRSHRERRRGRSGSGGEPTDDGGGEAAGDAAAGAGLYAEAGCGNCHTLADAGSTGAIGPNLDDSQPSFELAVEPDD